jgi:hypothetical protein
MSDAVSDIAQTGEVIHDSRWITIWYHHDARIIHHQIHDFLRGAPLREAFSKGTSVMKQHGATKWLSDDRLLSVMPPEDQQWAEQEWFPRTRQAGWRYWAIIKPEKAVSDLSLRRHGANWSAAGVLTEMFATPAEAWSWLRGVDKVPPSTGGQGRGRAPKL